MRKQGEDLSPRAGRRTQVRSVAAPGWQSVPPDRSSADDELLPRSSLAAWTAPCPPEPWMTSLCDLAAAGASGQEPGREAQSAGTGSLCAGRGCSLAAVCCSDEKLAKGCRTGFRHHGGPVRSAAAERPVS